MYSKGSVYLIFFAVVNLVAQPVDCFVSPAIGIDSKINADSNSGPLYSDSGQSGRMERIEFKIFPDGRVEEKVIGVQGSDCLEITREINEKLGKVISSSPTEEMYQEEVKIDQTLTNTNGDSDGSSWEGSSSW